jgi:hypothetical protein
MSMKIMFGKIITIAVFLSLPMAAFGRTNYIGYSGAPGTAGRCASSCHGTTGGTIIVDGFPTQYTPGQTYTISIGHNGGSTIRQFNGSVRIGTGTQNAGIITAGTNTATYNTFVESNGVHLSASNLDNASFFWTAPAAGTGEVKLYLAGHQGLTSGANTDLVLTATEITSAIDDEPSLPIKLAILNNYPNPFNPKTTIHYEIPQSGRVALDIFDIQGKKVANLFDGVSEAGKYDIVWNASHQPSGIYFCRLVVDNESISKMITLLK